MASVPATQRAGMVIDLDAFQRERRLPRSTVLTTRGVQVFSAALRRAEPHSTDYWRILDQYLRASGVTT
jgi:hypothetical protein